MIIPDENISEIDSVDRTQLRIFFSTPVGQKFLNVVAALCPEPLEDGGDVKVISRGGRVSGYQECVKNIVNLVFAPVVQNPTPDQNIISVNFPDLDDESKWEGDEPKH